MRIKTLLLLLLISTVTFAQKDAKAKSWLDKTSDTFAEAKDMSILFSMNIKNLDDNISESFEGSINIKGAKFHLDTPEMEAWFDGKVQWVLQKAWGEVSINEPSKEEVQAINPITIFNLYKAACNYKYIGEKKDAKGQAVHEIELTPIDKKSEMNKIIIQINPIDSLPVKIQITYNSNIENIIHINNYKKNQKLSDSSFVFNAVKYPDAEIIDLR
ncbi:outer membrane lipoprotein-sorting protein [Dysgonomonadaceae bacterium PH5-43]|nr:outer membrane lipoprotein-sorting protein [Dysgonomonadaceae bacterium PH5-43]